MRSNYNRMMEQVALPADSRAALRSRLTDPHRTRRPVRIALAAAVAVCVCLLLTAAVGAVGVIAGFLSIDRYELGDIGGEAYSGYRLNGGIVPVSIEDLSEELAAQEPGTRIKTFLTLEEAEQYVGVDLMQNPVLGQMAVSYASYPDWDGAVHCRVSALAGEEGVKSICLRAHYQGAGADTAYLPDDILVNLEARIVTEHGAAKRAFEVLFPSSKELMVERYEAAGGLEAVIIRTSGSETAEPVTLGGVDCEQRWYSAYFALDGIAYRLSAVGYEQTEPTDARPVLDLLKDVLDGYDLTVGSFSKTE